MPIQLVNDTDDLLCCHVLGHAMDCEGILSDYNDVSPMAVNEVELSLPGHLEGLLKCL